MIALLLSSLALAAPLCPQAPRPPLVVVLWERRDPGQAEGERPMSFSERQGNMQQALEVRLFGGKIDEPGEKTRCSPLITTTSNLSVFPEGLEQADPAISRIRNSESSVGVYRYLQGGISDDAQDAVRAIHVELDPSSRAALSSALRSKVIDPMLDGAGSNPTALRSVSNPWLMTHHALAAAFERHQLDETCQEPTEVYLIWVSAGVRNFKLTENIAGARRDFGEPGVDYYADLQARYELDPLDCSPDSPYISTYRVRLKHSPPPPLIWLDNGEAATLNYSSSRLPGEWFPPWEPALDEMPLPSWRLPGPEGFQIHSARASLQGPDGDLPPTELALAADGGALWLAEPAAFQQLLLDYRQRHNGGKSGGYSPQLTTELWLLPTPPPTPSGLWEALPPVRILEPVKGESPVITLSYLPIGLLVRLLILALLLLLAGVALLFLWLHTRPRALKVEMAIGDGGPIDLHQHRSQDSFPLPIRLKIADASRRLPRFLGGRLTVRASLTSYLQPDVPLKKTYQQLFQEIHGDGWEEDGGGLTRALRGPGVLSIQDRSLTVLTRHAAIDHARVERQEMVVVVGVTLDIQDRSGRFYPFSEDRFCLLRLQSVPGRPTPEWSFALLPSISGRHLETKLVGCFDGEWEGNRRAEIGLVELFNRPARTYSTLPVRFSLLKATARYTSSDGLTALEGELRLRDERGHDALYLPEDGRPGPTVDKLSGEEATKLAVIAVFPEKLRDNPIHHWKVTVELQLRAEALNFDGQIPPLPPTQRRFRMLTGGMQRILCLDFGTSSTRILLQDIADDQWGYLPIGEGVGEPLVDLPSPIYLGPNGQIWFGHAAEKRKKLHGKTEAHVYRDSVKSMMLKGSETLGFSFQDVIHQLLDQEYKPTFRGDARSLDVIQFNESGPLTKKVNSGQRHHFVVMLPNDATRGYEPTLRRAIESYPGFSGTLTMLREAEAVALWMGARVFRAPPATLTLSGNTLRILVLDFGAGTSDSALVEVNRPSSGNSPGAAEEQRTRILSTGGARFGGRDIEEALFNALARTNGWDVTWDTLYEEDRFANRPDLEALKQALAAGRVEADAALDLAIHKETARLVTPRHDLVSSPEYNQVLERMIKEPLAALIGRRSPREQGLSDVDLVAITGRASLTWKLKEKLEYELWQHQIPPERIYAPDKHYLKASVTLGAKLFAQGLCGDFVPSDRSFRDRILLVYRPPQREAAAIELLPPGEAFGGGTIKGPWHKVPYFEEGKLVRTWLAPIEGKASSPWQLDKERMMRMLLGEPLAGVSAIDPFVPIPVDFDTLRFVGTDSAERYTNVRVLIHPPGQERDTNQEITLESRLDL